ncbi:PTS subunit [Streptococcus cristatus]|uniref:PTS subunit n=1 Tax=uncultured Streptococcus sp. TaxID=83427 RepID=UPI000F67EA1E|nr:PTS subunit [uncultured Streptococcus sp.]MBZ2152433.1 PTS subunit [Streptococcus cristatus]
MNFVLIYLFHRTNLLLFIVGVILAILGILVMLVFGYGIYKGRLNLQKVIDDFEEKLKLAQ